MISIQRSSGFGIKAMWGGLALAVIGAAVWWFTDFAEPHGQVPPVAEVSTAQTPLTNAGAASTVVLPDTTDSEDAQLADTAALGQAMAKQADGQQQLNRVITFLRFQREFEKWQEMQGEGDPVVRAALGQKLLAQLPEHVAKSSMTLPEGEFMCGMVLSDSESNEALRDSKIQACQERVRAVGPKPDSAQAIQQADCEADYRAREAALVGAFQTLPSAQRDSARLQADLDKAKQDVYNDAKCKP